jgi:hypothetical protein
MLPRLFAFNQRWDFLLCATFLMCYHLSLILSCCVGGGGSGDDAPVAGDFTGDDRQAAKECAEAMQDTTKNQDEARHTDEDDARDV